MDNIKNLILNSLKYYDVNNEKYLNFFNKVAYYRILEGVNDLDHHQIIFYDKNKAEFYRTKYEILGCYHKDIKLWIWGWILGSKKSEIIISRKLLNYGLDLEKEFNFLKMELITSKFRLISDFQLDIHISIASYISKNPLIFKLVTSTDIHDKYTEYLVNDPTTEIHKYVSQDISSKEEIFYLYLLDEYKE